MEGGLAWQQAAWVERLGGGGATPFEMKLPQSIDGENRLSTKEYPEGGQ